MPDVKPPSFEELAMLEEVGGGTVFNPTCMEELDSSNWIASVRHRCRENGGMRFAGDLFLYRHRITGVFMLSMWLDRRRGMMRELLAFRGNPDREEEEGEREDVPSMEDVVERLRPAAESLAACREELREARRREMERQGEVEEKRQAAVRILRNRHEEDTAEMIRRGMVPFFPSGAGEGDAPCTPAGP